MTSRNCPWRPNRVEAIAQVGAAPHLAAAIFSPYSDGEKDAFAKDFANIQRCKKSAERAASPFSPSLYGEKMAAAR
ncbi:hypothetical protein [Mesorhizobium sp.]|uniref:hypothetical protein n=1 Tax=Mesorhizobium sp. TaxID=1871066 RepID=UPI00257EF842|nr:hypothetical protein [Mesorhizobium sp.]